MHPWFNILLGFVFPEGAARRRRAGSGGFSLTELSLSLVIMSVIASAVMGGMKLLEYAKTRALLAGADTHQSAVYGFAGKFNQYPGDFTEATIYWPGAKVQNGDGDGKIMYANDGGVQEGFNAWQHLALAGMENRDYAGAAVAPVAAAVPGVHVPESIYGGSFFLTYGFGGLKDKNALVVGVPVGGGAQLSAAGFLLQHQAREADAKSDDGNPSTGNVRGLSGTGTDAASPCTDDNNTPDFPDDDVYALKVKEGKSCLLAFQIVSQ